MINVVYTYILFTCQGKSGIPQEKYNIILFPMNLLGFNLWSDQANINSINKELSYLEEPDWYKISKLYV
jgi:hypothetical protein